VATVAYDEKGRVTSLRDAKGKASGQALTLGYRTAGDGAVETTRAYPPSGLEPPYRPVVVESFSAAGLLMKRVTRPTSGGEPLSEEFAYAPDGALVSVTRQGGATARPQATPAAGQSSGLTLLDVGGPPLLRALLDALAKVEAGSLVHLEDGFGRVTAFDAPADLSNPFVRNGTWLIDYDAEDRIRFVLAPRGEQAKPQPGQASAAGIRLAAPSPVPPPDLELRYDEVGNLVEVLEPDGKTTRYRYDDRNLLIEVREPGGTIRELTYDDRGDPTGVRIAAGGKQQATDYAFDGLRRLRRVTDYPKWPDKKQALVAETVFDSRGGSQVVVYQR
jgi:YD repeat-containing protein